MMFACIEPDYDIQSVSAGAPDLTKVLKAAMDAKRVSSRSAKNVTALTRGGMKAVAYVGASKQSSAPVYFPVLDRS